MAPLTEALLENKTLSMLNLGQNAIMDQGKASKFDDKIWLNCIFIESNISKLQKRC